MQGINRVILLGNVGRDVEIRYTSSGTPVASVSLATTEKYRAGGEQRENTEWHRLVMWGGLAEMAGRYIKKGIPLFVEGRMNYRIVEDRNSGTRRVFPEVLVEKLSMVGGKKQKDSSDDDREALPV